MKNIFFIGAGGFASECYCYLQDIMKVDKDIIFKGFLSTSNDLAQYGLSDLYLGSYDDYEFQEYDYAVIAIGTPSIRKQIYFMLKKRGVKLYTLISPYSVVPEQKNLGEGSIIANFVTIAANAKIGVCNVINSLSAVGHDVEISNFNVISSHADICGNTKIGNCNFFGSRCSTLPHTVIGDNNKIAAGSVLYKKYRDNNVIQGNPAVCICKTEDL